MEILFWSSIIIVFYAYLGYGILLLIIVKIKMFLTNKSLNTFDDHYFPTVTFIVPCYNEIDMIDQKVTNCLSLDYPREKISYIFITDGSNDGTPELVSKYSEITLLHENKREGKSAAENRAMKFVKSEITIFSDANTILPETAIKKLIRHYINPKVGAVSGEKKINTSKNTKAVSSGEGIYWKYESYLKKLDSELNSIVGAAGELFSFRSELFENIEKDTILDDFMLSMRIAAKGYKVVYEPEAQALETASSSIKEELKRKIRICAGGWQAMSRLTHLLIPYKNKVLTFQYISHRVLRWTIVPILLFVILISNIYLFNENILYFTLLLLQAVFYIAAFIGYLFEKINAKVKFLFVPYYFIIMNYAVIIGYIRFMRGNQSSAWERSKRGI